MKKKARGIKRAKGYQPRTPVKNYFIANYGNASGAAVNFSKEFSHSDSWWSKSNAVKITPNGIKIIERELAHALKTKDGRFFREIAQLCEQSGFTFKCDVLARFLIGTHFDTETLRARSKQNKAYAMRQLVQYAEECAGLVKGKPASRARKIRRLCAQLGIEICR